MAVGAVSKTLWDYSDWIFECSASSEPSTVVADLDVPVFRIKAKRGDQVFLSSAESLVGAWESLVEKLDGTLPAT